MILIFGLVVARVRVVNRTRFVTNIEKSAKHILDISQSVLQTRSNRIP
jgi:hypothetical protein